MGAKIRFERMNNVQLQKHIRLLAQVIVALDELEPDLVVVTVIVQKR